MEKIPIHTSHIPRICPKMQRSMYDEVYWAILLPFSALVRATTQTLRMAFAPFRSVRIFADMIQTLHLDKFRDCLCYS
jgi:hypothetical protein